MASLYQLTGEILTMQEWLETGEIPQDVYDDTVEAMMVDDKLESIAKVMRNLDGDIKLIREEENELAEKRRSLEKNLQRLKDSVCRFMSATNSQKKKAGIFEFRVKEYPSVDIKDANLLESKWRVPQPDKVDRAGILNALKAGEVIPGCELKYTARLNVK